MIATVTLNPSLDYLVTLDDFAAGRINRARRETLLPGGKGINVSLALRRLGIESVAFGYQAGFTGRQLRSALEEEGLAVSFVTVREGMTRINVKIRGKEETELNGAGPLPSPAERRELYERIGRPLREGDVLVLAGSAPGGDPASCYQELLSALPGGRGVRLVADLTGESLRRALAFRPFLVKPNRSELEDLLQTPCRSIEELLAGARRVQEMGAEHVLVSLAGEGALLLDGKGEAFLGRAPQGTVVCSAGAGDSMVAGFLAGLLRTGSMEEALRLGLEIGSASAFSEGIADRRQIERLAGQAKVQRLPG